MSVRKLLLFGGTGFVGCEVAKRASRGGWHVVCATRGGAPWSSDDREQWTANVDFVILDATSRVQVQQFIADHSDATAVISCIGLLTRNYHLGRRINGDTTVNIAAVVHERPSIRSFVFISAQPPGPVSALLRGYFRGKVEGERAITENLKERGAAFRATMIYGPRQVFNGQLVLPLQVVGRPLEAFLRLVQRLTGWRLTEKFGGLFAPPIGVDVIASAAVSICECAMDPSGFWKKATSRDGSVHNMRDYNQPISGVLDVDEVQRIAALVPLEHEAIESKREQLHSSSSSGEGSPHQPRSPS